MHSADIKAEIEKKGYTQVKIAQEYGCSNYFVSKVIKEGQGSEPLIKFICKIINIPTKIAFPKWHNRPNKRTRHKN